MNKIKSVSILIAVLFENVIMESSTFIASTVTE